MFTQEQLIEKTGPELVEIFNGLPGVTQVKRFTNRDTGIRRILASQVVDDLAGTGLASLGVTQEVLSDPANVVSEPAKRGRKKQPRGTYNLTGGERKRSYRANSRRGRLLAVLTADGATFEGLLGQLEEFNTETLHNDIKMVSRWLGFDVTTDDAGIIRASR